MQPSKGVWISLAPALFVLLWSTGFIGAKLGLPYAEPLTFLLIRMLLVTGLLLLAARITGAPWPTERRQVGRIALAGLLVHGGYLGGVFSAIHSGLPAGTVALIVGLQPILTALGAGPLLGERVSARQWVGLTLGLLGVTLVVSAQSPLALSNWSGTWLAAAALFCITAGTLYQKRYCGAMDFRSGGAIQYGACILFYLPLALALESMRVTWSGEFVFALIWLSLVLSLGAISLLYLLIRRGEAARVSSLFYATPPTTAVMAWLIFNEPLTGAVLLGMAVTAVGVALAMRPEGSTLGVRGPPPSS